VPANWYALNHLLRTFATVNFRVSNYKSYWTQITTNSESSIWALFATLNAILITRQLLFSQRHRCIVRHINTYFKMTQLMNLIRIKCRITSTHTHVLTTHRTCIHSSTSHSVSVTLSNFTDSFDYSVILYTPQYFTSIFVHHLRKIASCPSLRVFLNYFYFFNLCP